MTRGRVAALVAGVAAVVAAVGLLVVVLAGGGGHDPVTYRYVIPAGTGDRIAAGEDVRIVPSVLDVRVGDRLVLRNKDEIQHHMGPLFVDANGLLTLSFSDPGVIQGVCNLNRSGQARIVVRR